MNRHRLPTGIQAFRAGLHHDLAYCRVLSRRSIWL